MDNQPPIDLYFDCARCTPEMAEWLQLSGAMARFERDKSDHQDPYIEVQFSDGRRSHVYAGSQNIRIFFSPRDYQSGLMFLMKFREDIYYHNLPQEYYEHY